MVNGMLIFDDINKTQFKYLMPYKGQLDAYLGLSGSNEYAFRFNSAIFSTIPTSSVLSLESDVASGVYFNYVGTHTKALSHTQGQEEGYDFVCVRQPNGEYIIYG